jgi:hypothetical protein
LFTGQLKFCSSLVHLRSPTSDDPRFCLISGEEDTGSATRFLDVRAVMAGGFADLARAVDSALATSGRG